MIQTELYIDGNLIELSDESLVSLTFQINDIAELKDRNADFSNIFKAPATAKNKMNLEFCTEGTSNSGKPYRYGAARIVQGGVTVLPIGIAEITGGEFSEFQIKVLAGNGKFFSDIQSKKLSELDYSSINHTWDFTTVWQSWLNTWQEGYKYSIINYGRLDGTRLLRAEYLRPAIFGKKLIDLIFQGSGYTPVGEFLDSYEMNRLLLPFCKDKAVHSGQWITDNSLKATKTARQTFSSGSFQTDGIVFENDSTAGNFDPGNHWKPAYFDGSVNRAFDFNGTKVKFRFTLNVTFDPGNTWQYCFLAIVDDNNYDNNYGTYAINGDGIHVIETDWILHTPGRPIIFTINGLFGGTDIVYIDPGSTFEIIAIDSPIEYGHSWEWEQNVPDMTQTDFLKSLAQLYGLVFITDSLNKRVYFKQFKELYRNKLISKDWTDKIDSKTASVSFKIGSYGQKNYLRYKVDSKDTDFIAESADSFFPIDNTTLPITKDLFTLPYAGTAETNTFGGFQIPLIRKQKPAAVPDDYSFQINTAQRILYDFPVKATDLPGTTITLEDFAGSLDMWGSTYFGFCYFQQPPQLTTYLGPWPGTVYTGTVKKLSWVDLIRDNYGELGLMLFKVFMVKVKGYLKPVDIETLNHFIPIYLEQFSAYFYLNKVDKYVNDGRLTNLELIRM